MTLTQLAKNLLGVFFNELAQVQEKVNAKGSVTGDQVIDLSLGNVVTATLTGPGNWSITNMAPAGKSSTVTLILTDAGANITWVVTPKWVGGVPPVFTVAGTDILVLTTVDGGTTWYASTSLNLS